MKKIVLTGGGTAGHVIPHIALIPLLQEEGYEIHYIGSHDGIEKSLITPLQIPYHSIATGKLRRYLDKKNVTDAFRVVKGIHDALALLRKIKPNIIFSKGGFVAFPVTVAGKLLKIPVVVHESDFTPGLANKMAFPFAKKILTAFKETLSYVDTAKALHVGTPIRASLLKGDGDLGRRFLQFTNQKPILLVMGGSLGSQNLNRSLEEALEALLDTYQICHIRGKGNLNPALCDIPSYVQYEYITEELPHILKATDIVLSRAGANAIFEFLALQIPHLLVPLGLSASRGDQIVNAKSFCKKGYSKVLFEENLSAQSLIQNINDLYKDKNRYIAAMEDGTLHHVPERIVSILKDVERASRNE